MVSLLPGKVIGEGILKLERVQVICPACGRQVEAVARDGQVKGYCAVAVTLAYLIWKEVKHLLNSFLTN